MLLIKNAKFVSELTENNLVAGDILVDGNKILKVESKIDEKDNMSILDANGMYVMPGFIDLHVHLNLSGGDVLYDNFKDKFFMCMEGYKFALDSLYAGFTTIRDVGSNYGMVNGIRDAIEKEGMEGPKILSSGRIITPTENGNEYFPEMYNECDGVTNAYYSVRKEIQSGADFIKIMASGAIMNPGGEPGSPIYSNEELKQIVDVAKIKGKYIAAHAHSAEAVNQCFDCGVRTIEHASLIDDIGIKNALTSKTTFLVPTVTAFAGMATDDTMAEGASHINEKIRKFNEQFLVSMKKAYKAGVKMGFGTDQGVTGTFHGENADEFIYRKDIIGMSNIDILKQATIYSAEIAQIDDKVGLIKTGLEADLVILNSNPLDDISVCRLGVDSVIKGGKVVCQNKQVN